MRTEADRACIVGIGQSRFTKWGQIMDSSELELAGQSILDACAEAGLPPSQIDGFVSYGTDRNEPAIVHTMMGSEQVRLSAQAWGGGGGGSCGALALAATAVRAGSAHHVVVYRSVCQGQSFRFGQFHPWAPGGNFIYPFGLFAPPQLMAMIVRRHMAEFGTTAEQMARISMACYAHAANNPNAVMRHRTLDLETYFASRMIADPFRLYDCCLESDGACAVLVTTVERAKDLRGTPVEILAVGQASEKDWGTGPLGGYNMPDHLFITANTRSLAAELYGRAGVGPRDIDVAQFYDDFSGMVLLSIEDFGFCGRGEAGPFVASGAIDGPDALLPINTSGGSIAEAYIHGLNLVVEGVRQMRGVSTGQVRGAQTCLVTAGPGTGPTSAAILGRI